MQMLCIGFYEYLIALACCASSLDALCSPTSAGIKRFGKDCRYACHCMNNDQCDTNTGECNSGCDFKWVGPGCQYKNIALNHLSRHMDNKDPPAYSREAHDNSLLTCSSTNTSEAAPLRTIAPWWTLWFPYYTAFKDLVFTTKAEYLSQFPRFDIIVQNISRSDSDNWVYYSSGVLCYQHDYSIPAYDTVKITCTGTAVGNQVRIQLANTSTQLVLCDFRVYGECKDRTWGKPCINECGFCKDFSNCDTTTGHCPTGCKTGYTTPICNIECDTGKYGQNCTYSCSGNCKNNVTCDRHNGSCISGCTLGRFGDQCGKACPVGHYGHECKEKCSPNCAGGEGNCDKAYGTCKAGCSPGWNGRTCQEECEDGTFGMNCQETCNEHCNDICNKTNGNCRSCKSGWHGYNCSAACRKGTWGERCLRACGKCLNGSCDRFDGACSGNCQPGYKLKLYCDEDCEMGWYGNNCTGQCSPDCTDVSLCRKSDGYCETAGLTRAVTAVIAGVGSSVIVVNIFGVLAILLYLRRKRKGENTPRLRDTPGNALADFNDKTRSIAVKSKEGTDDAYDTIQVSNVDEHQYEQPDEKHRH